MSEPSDMSQENQPPELIEQGNKHEPMFNNLNYGTVILLGIMVLVHIVRQFAPQGYEFNWAADSVFDTNILKGTSEYDGMGFVQRYWPLIGYQFIHSGVFHLVMNAAMLMQVGPFTEISFIKGANIVNYRHIKYLPQVQGAKIAAAILFIIYFLACGVAAGIGYYLLNMNSQGYLVGASGSISGIFGGYLIAAFKMAPEGRYVFKPVVSSGIVFLLVNVLGAYLLRASGMIPIAWEAHLAGFVAGMILYPVFMKISERFAGY